MARSVEPCVRHANTGAPWTRYANLQKRRPAGITEMHRRWRICEPSVKKDIHMYTHKEGERESKRDDKGREKMSSVDAG